MSQITLPVCAKCYHPKSNHESSVCSGSLECMCQKYIEPILFEFAQLVEKEKLQRKNVEKRCEFILDKIPPSRNAGEKAFAKLYREIWYGFKIRKEGTKLTTDEWKRMIHDDTINRSKRKIKQKNEGLRTYDPKVLLHQSAIFTALMELSTES